MNQGVEEIDPEEEEERLERVAAIDVAKASGKVCTRVPHPSVPNRRVTKVWDVSATTNAIALLADELAEMAIERVVVESTSDYWRPFLYLLEARGLKVWLVNARDVKQVPGRPKTDKIDAIWLAKLNERGMLRPSFVPPTRSGSCATTPGCARTSSRIAPGTYSGSRSCSRTRSSSSPRLPPTSWASRAGR